MNKIILEAREDFPALKRLRNGKPPIYLDNACTTLVPNQVIDKITEYYMQHPACEKAEAGIGSQKKLPAESKGTQAQRSRVHARKSEISSVRNLKRR